MRKLRHRCEAACPKAKTELQNPCPGPSPTSGISFHDNVSKYHWHNRNHIDKIYK